MERMLLDGEDAVLVQSCSTNADAVVSVDAQRGISSAEYELNHLGHGNSSLARHRSIQKRAWFRF